MQVCSESPVGTGPDHYYIKNRTVFGLTRSAVAIRFVLALLWRRRLPGLGTVIAEFDVTS